MPAAGAKALVRLAGRALLASSTGTWRSFTDAMDKLLGTEGEEAA